MSPSILAGIATQMRRHVADTSQRLALPAAPEPRALGDPAVAAATRAFLTHHHAAARRLLADHTAMAAHLEHSATSYRDTERAITEALRDTHPTSRTAEPGGHTHPRSTPPRNLAPIRGDFTPEPDVHPEMPAEHKTEKYQQMQRLIRETLNPAASAGAGPEGGHGAGGVR